MLKLGKLLTQNVESVETAIRSAQRLLWNIAIAEVNGTWAVLAGDSTLVVTDNLEAAHAFVYGMGLAYSVIPEDITRAYLESVGLGEEYKQSLLNEQQNKEGGN